MKIKDRSRVGSLGEGTTILNLVVKLGLTEKRTLTRAFKQTSKHMQRQYGISIVRQYKVLVRFYSK